MGRDFRGDVSAKEIRTFQKLNSYSTTLNDKEKEGRYPNNDGRYKGSYRTGCALKGSE